MDVGAFVWVDLAAAVVLALWVTGRHPELRPRTLRSAVMVFFLGQLVARLGVLLVAPVMQLPHGVQLVLLVVVLPVLFGMVVTSLWLVRAVADAIAGPRGGHPVRGSSRHAPTYRAPSRSARSR